MKTLPGNNFNDFSPFNDGKSEDVNKTISEKVVLPDECGESLWGEVLAQDEHPNEMKNEQAYDAHVNREELVKKQQSPSSINSSEKIR